MDGNKKAPEREGEEIEILMSRLTNIAEFTLDTLYKKIKDEIKHQLKEDSISFTTVRLLRHELTNDGTGWTTIKTYFTKTA